MRLLLSLACFEPDDLTDASAHRRLDGLDALVAALSGVDDRHDADLTALSARLDALEQELAVTRAENTARGEELAAADEARAQLEDDLQVLAASQSDLMARVDAMVVDPSVAALADVVQVNDAGDVVFSGVNVYVQSGAGATHAAPNGKGNLILGYAEGAGDELRTGSHTLVAGIDLDWQSRWGIVMGRDHVLSGDGALILGGEGSTVSAAGAGSVGGHQHTVTHRNAVNVAGARTSSSVECGFRASGTNAGSGC